jgi:hypothetical protein
VAAVASDLPIANWALKGARRRIERRQHRF